MLDQPKNLIQWKTSLVGKGRALDIAYLNFRNTFDTISPSDPQREAVEMWAGWADCEVDLKYAEHPSP